ncbi:MAG: hypothetical protein IPP63_02290 [Chloracidobacterium sp.]|nr:hypothetical protein [Chloracidobacterium sp.]
MKRTVILLTFLLSMAAAASLLGQGVAVPYTARLMPYLQGLSRPILLRSAKDGTKHFHRSAGRDNPSAAARVNGAN